jgi:phosphohistidine phosphatase
MIVYLLRHASAGQHTLNSKEDEKRPLDKEGEKQSRDVGRAFAALKIEVDVVVSSPLTRALQTARIAAKEFGLDDKIVTDDSMRPEASYDQFQDLLSRYRKNKAILVVGHNPSITEFVQRQLTGNESRDWFEFKKGAVVKLEVEGQKATLNWVITPKLVRVLQTASTSNSRPKTLRK